MKSKSLVKKGLLLLGVVVAIVFLLFVIMVKSGSNEIVSPDRAPGIPADHQWYGGVDGGTWIHCDPQNDFKEFQCSVFSESGSLLGKGLYRPSRDIVPPYEFTMGGQGSIDLKDQQGKDLVLNAEGWIEHSEGKAHYKNGQLTETP